MHAVVSHGEIGRSHAADIAQFEADKRRMEEEERRNLDLARRLQQEDELELQRERCACMYVSLYVCMYVVLE